MADDKIQEPPQTNREKREPVQGRVPPLVQGLLLISVSTFLVILAVLAIFVVIKILG